MNLKYPQTFNYPSITTVIEKPDTKQSLGKSRKYGKHLKPQANG
jgi:hypothetical protein